MPSVLLRLNAHLKHLPHHLLHLHHLPRLRSPQCYPGLLHAEQMSDLFRAVDVKFLSTCQAHAHSEWTLCFRVEGALFSVQLLVSVANIWSKLQWHDHHYVCVVVTVGRSNLRHSLIVAVYLRCTSLHTHNGRISHAHHGIMHYTYHVMGTSHHGDVMGRSHHGDVRFF